MSSKKRSRKGIESIKKQIGIHKGKLKHAKEITFAKWGNSIAIRIPIDIVDEYNIKSGSHGILTKDKEGIRIIPA